MTLAGIGRALRFGLSVSAFAGACWTLYGLVLLWIGQESAASLIVVVTSGIIFTVFAMGILRVLPTRYSPTTQRGMAAGAILGSAVLWWVLITPHAPSVHSWVSILAASVLICATDFIRRHCHLKRLRYAEARQWENFALAPKALGGTAGIPLLVARLGALAESGGYRWRKERNEVASLQHELTVASDPRFTQPMPLPVALEFLRKEFEYGNGSETARAELQAVDPTSECLDLFIEPALLCAAALFAAQYGAERLRDRVRLKLKISRGLPSMISIETNIPGGDLWFTLDSGSPAETTKFRLVDWLNTCATGSSQTFEVAENGDSCVVLRFLLQPVPPAEMVWQEVEQRLAGAALLSRCEESQGVHRVYVKQDLIYKVQLLRRPNPKPLSLAEEYNVLCRLDGVAGIPSAVKYEQHPDFSVLSCKRIDGVNLAEYLANAKHARPEWFRCLADLSELLKSIHERGVVHRDLTPENILVNRNGKVSLIDFDQAVLGSPEIASLDLLGEARGAIPPGQCWGHLIEQLGLTQEYSEVVSKLKKAWASAAGSNASSPGQNMAYYSWAFGTTALPGERDWLKRWKMMAPALEPILAGARILDLGCNLGLFDTFCALHGAEQVIAVDLQHDILAAAASVAETAGIEEKIVFKQGDLNSAEFVDSLLDGRQHTLVSALSVLHWIKNKDTVLRLVSSAPHLLYEGHGQPSEERDLLVGLGFRDVRLLGYSERLRALYFASR